MARINSHIENETFQAAVELYTGRKVASLLRHDDPEVAGCVALRATMEGGDVIDFLLSANSRFCLTATALADELEECEFTAWPPRSGEPKFL